MRNIILFPPLRVFFTRNAPFLAARLTSYLLRRCGCSSPATHRPWLHALRVTCSAVAGVLHPQPTVPGCTHYELLAPPLRVFFTRDAPSLAARLTSYLLRRCGCSSPATHRPWLHALRDIFGQSDQNLLHKA